MTYDLHPIFVHFPIALLTIYSIIKILPLQRWFPRISWRHLERALLVLGVLGAFAALSTGETAEHITRPNRQLVNMHSLFAGIATWMYGLLLLGEVLSVLLPFISRLNISKITALVSFFQKFLTKPLLSKTLALLGLVAITVTGLLGGVMVYGVTADPLAPFVLKLLGLNI